MKELNYRTTPVRVGYRNADDDAARNTGQGRTLVTAVRVRTTDAHWHLSVFSRGFRVGELSVGAEDGPNWLNLLLPRRVEDNTV